MVHVAQGAATSTRSWELSPFDLVFSVKNAWTDPPPSPIFVCSPRKLTVPEIAPDFAATCVICENVFAPAELDSIEHYGDSLDQQKASLAGEGRARDGGAARIRITRTAAMSLRPEVKWLYDRMQVIIRKVNWQVYQFDLHGFTEPFQYTVYHGAEGGHYDWHIDWGPHRV